MTSDTIPIREGEGLDVHRLEQYLKANIDEIPNKPLEISQFSAGKSNLTYQLKVGNWEAVLRRPPMGPVAPKAHDMEREYKVLQEIHPFFNQAPKPFIYSDKELLGAPFFIMERKKGVVIDDSLTIPDGDSAYDVGQRISQLMVNALVQLHDINYQKTKLKDMTRPAGFMQRQVDGWISRYHRSKTDEILGIDELTNWLESHLPHSEKTTIIHYDFKLNNSMFNQQLTRLIGVFDWEMSTVGDPLADLGVALSYWHEKGDSDLLKRGLGDESVTTKPGFFTREEFIQAYALKSGTDVSQIHYYLTFAYFKLAVICQQIYYRWKRGQTKDERFSNLNLYVNNLIQHAVKTSRRKL
ncbi:phosphotransferase family protein [Cytobacillus kochii]|uniref:phosphotransferase family protein n=1 Tax=Cytobacillus kochii TaxID=859143 RepID=UPI00203E1E5E|nr:phosphotransferase family protein [Cytobacillus kochii]MCM3321542.1 phosphotransferase family protein [Cytobacillus kochii]MCM3343624.1 phosphotransferase family protein [Cytobacillus kochii]